MLNTAVSSHIEPSANIIPRGALRTGKQDGNNTRGARERGKDEVEDPTKTSSGTLSASLSLPVAAVGTVPCATIHHTMHSHTKTQGPSTDFTQSSHDFTRGVKSEIATRQKGLYVFYSFYTICEGGYVCARRLSHSLSFSRSGPTCVEQPRKMRKIGKRPVAVGRFGVYNRWGLGVKSGVKSAGVVSHE